MTALNDVQVKLANALLKLQDSSGYFKDPVQKLERERSRSAAEIGKSLMILGKEKEAGKAFDYVISSQNANGSWNEIHPDLNEESCVETSIIGLILLKVFAKTKNKKMLDSAIQAGEYVLSKEFSPGYFIKTPYHYSNVLNVNANCAAFLNALHEATQDKKYLEARDRAIFNVVKWQFKSGAFPYASPEQTFPYLMHNHVPDFHYHAITLYYLLQADPKLENRYAKIAAEKAVQWMEKNLSSNGWNWSKNKLNFSLGSTASYAYAAASLYALKRKHSFEACINKLKSLQKDYGFNRTENVQWTQGLTGAIGDVVNLDISHPLKYPFVHRVYIARERVKQQFLKKEFSLYYSAQILDCLTEIQEEKK